MATLQCGTTLGLTHITKLHAFGALIVPCCDDTMLFNTNMSSEIFELVKMLGVGKDEHKAMAVRAVEAVFDEGQRERLAKALESFC